jgi:hypothetical protein
MTELETTLIQRRDMRILADKLALVNYEGFITRKVPRSWQKGCTDYSNKVDIINNFSIKLVQNT